MFISNEAMNVRTKKKSFKTSVQIVRIVQNKKKLDATDATDDEKQTIFL
jgi:hypothetical protein